MSFAFSKGLNSNRVFLTRKAELVNRWDPFYFIPSTVKLEKQVQKVTSKKLRDYVIRMAGGATPLTSEAEKHYTENDDGVPFVRVQNLSTTGKLNLEYCKFITRNTHETLLARSRLSGGELLVKITGVGRMAVASVTPEGFEGNINQHIVAIRTKDINTSETLAAYLNLDIAERLASRRATGGTRPALDYPALLSIPIIYDERIPKLINKAIEQFETQNAKAHSLLEHLDAILLKELAVQLPHPLPNIVKDRIFEISFSKITGKRWDPLFYQNDILGFVRNANCPLEKLGDHVVYFFSGFAAGRGDQSDEEGIIQIRPTNITDDRKLSFHRNVFIPAIEMEKRQGDIVKRGEVLFNNTNSQEQVGKTVYFDLEENFFCSNHITRIRTTHQTLDPQYLCYILNLYQRQRVFFRACTNWNNQSGVGVDILKPLHIPLPRLINQQKIVERLEEVRVQAQSLQRKAVMELEDAKRSIEAMILVKGYNA